MISLISQHSVLDGKINLGSKSIVSSLSLYLQKRKQRKQLLQLEDHLLFDIGITRQQAIDEAGLK